MLERFPQLRINLAHFGGQIDWEEYLSPNASIEAELGENENFMQIIRDLITGGDHPQIWMDISYTLFHFQKFIPLLKVFMLDPKLRERILFGSDWYMTEQEDLSEQAVSFSLRVQLGDEDFRQIAETNPAKWLGEADLPGQEAPLVGV